MPNSQIQNILVTGSSGMIGTRLCELLIENSYNVLGVDRRKNVWNPLIDACTLHMDLLDLDTMLQELPCDVDMIVHLAANARVHDLIINPSLAKENIDTTYNVLEYARLSKIGRIIFASSREVYGNQEKVHCNEADVFLSESASTYSASKISGESLVHAYARSGYGIKPLMFRFSNVYGMYDESDRVIPQFISKATSHEDLTIFGKDKLLDFTYIDDAVQSVLCAIKKFEVLKPHSVYNIGCGEGSSIEDVANYIRKALNSSSNLIYKPNRTGEVVTYTADTTKLQADIQPPGFLPLSEGLQETIDWYIH